jgi:hypothetical protein
MGQWDHSHCQWIETQEQRKPKHPKDEKQMYWWSKTKKKNPFKTILTKWAPSID